MEFKQSFKETRQGFEKKWPSYNNVVSVNNKKYFIIFKRTLNLMTWAL